LQDQESVPQPNMWSVGSHFLWSTAVFLDACRVLRHRRCVRNCASGRGGTLLGAYIVQLSAAPHSHVVHRAPRTVRQPVPRLHPLPGRAERSERRPSSTASPCLPNGLGSHAFTCLLSDDRDQVAIDVLLLDGAVNWAGRSFSLIIGSML
jgi:hypothetical protein